MADFLQGLLDGLIGGLANFLQPILNACTALIETVANTILTALLALLPADWAASFGSTPWSSLQSYFGPLNWFIPIYQIFGLYVAAYSIIASIRFVRWCMALVPGVSILGNSVGPFGGA